MWKLIATWLGFETRTPRNDSGGCLHPYSNDCAYRCRCHAQLGNDFYFLPTGTCLYGKDAAK